MDKITRSCWHHRARLFIELRNSISLMVFLFPAQVSTSLPVRYQRFGFLLVTASRITYETTSTEAIAFPNIVVKKIIIAYSVTIASIIL